MNSLEFFYVILSIVFRKFVSKLNRLTALYQVEHFPSRMLAQRLPLTGNGQTGTVQQAVSA